MAIRFACPTCKKTLSAPDEKAGVKTTCPGCKTALLIPPPNAVQTSRPTKVDEPQLTVLPAKTAETPPPPEWQKSIPPAVVSVIGNPILVVVALCCCFPIGLGMIWINPTWDKKKKWTWTGGFFAVVVIFGVIGQMREREVAKNIEQADQLWQSGKKAEAITLYKNQLEDLTYMNRNDKPTIFQRVIEYEVEQGNTSYAKDLISKARTYGVPLSLNNQRAKQIVAELDEEARKKAESEKSSPDEKRPADLRAAAKGISKGMSVAEVRHLLGKPDMIYGQGRLFALTYEGGKIVVAFTQSGSCIGLLVDGTIVFGD